MIKAAVFDLDHTLFDRRETVGKIFRESPKSELPFREDIAADKLLDIYMSVEENSIELGWEHMAMAFLKKGILKPSVEKEKELFQGEAFYKKYICPVFAKTAVPFDFALPTLEKLKNNGLKTALITNGTLELQTKKLTMLGLQNAFDEILICGEIGFQKPSSEPFLEMSKRLFLLPEEMLYIGDNAINDISGARNAGYRTVWVKTRKKWLFPDIPRADYVVDTVAEIPELIERINHTVKSF